MKLSDLGYNTGFHRLVTENKLESFDIGRVIAEHKERYIVETEKGEMEAEITGNLRFSAKGREDFPAVGDWVALTVYDSGFAIIHSILPRFSVITRKAVGQYGEIQIIAANIDYAFLVQAVDRDFNINRLERYLTICHSTKVNPIIILTKSDLVEEQRLTEIITGIRQRIHDIPVIAVSNETRDGYAALDEVIEKGKTYCMLGSSGVGKSTLVNNLSGREIMKTDAISSSTSKGRHITSHRELTLLDNGAILIDNPGMREVGITDTTGGLETTFDMIHDLAHYCRYMDCTHIHEAGCKVIEAVEKGEIERDSYDNYLKMVKEKTHFETTVAEKKKKDKEFGKIVKDYYKKDVKQRRG
jgi:ribosome biogenesis GTPase